MEKEEEDGECDFFGRVSRVRMTKDLMNEQVKRTKEGGEEECDFFGRVSRVRKAKDCMNKQVRRIKEGGDEDSEEEESHP